MAEPRRKSSRKAASRRNSTAVAIIVTVLVGLFVALGIGPAAHLVARVVPVSAERVEIVSRDSHTSVGGWVGRGVFSGGTTYYLALRDAGGETFTVVAPRELYDLAFGVGRLSDVSLERSWLFGLPVAVTLTTEPLVNIPAVGLVGEPDSQRYSLLIPLVGALIAAVFCFAIVGYLIWKLPRKHEFHWALFATGITAAAVLGLFWWL